MLGVIRNQTQIPDPIGLLMYHTDTPSASILVRYLMPVLSRVVDQRNVIVEDRFYLESRYYKFVALHQSLQLSKLQEVVAANTDFLLRTYFFSLQPSHDSSVYEIVFLLRCLIATAMAKLCLIDVFDVYSPDEIHPVIMPSDSGQDFAVHQDQLEKIRQNARGGLRSLLRELSPELTKWRKDGTARMKASATSLLAHVARLRSEQAKAGEPLTLFGRFREDEADPVQLFEEALAEEPTAIRYIELGEYLASQSQKEEAYRLLRLARRVAPRHPVLTRWLPRE
jgi:hypothetical protein